MIVRPPAQAPSVWGRWHTVGLILAACWGVGAESLPHTELSMAVGEVRTHAVEGLTRVAIGNPEIVDVTIVSTDEILIKSQSPGTTNFILWDQRGQHAMTVTVKDALPEQMAQEAERVIRELAPPGVMVRREDNKVLVTGQVATPAELQGLQEMVASYPDVVNLVQLAPAQPPPPPPPPRPPLSVKITVQVVEITHDATDKFGVDWADSLTFTETVFGVTGPEGAGSLLERVEDAFRFGSLKRNELNPVLNMLVSNGKARILTEPKLVAASGKDATAFLGVEVPIITTTSVSSGTVSQSIEFKKTGVELRFKPTVLDDDRSIQLMISAKVSSIDNAVGIKVSGILVPGFRTRQTETDIVTGSGESVLISGMLQDEEKKNLSQVPGAGSIPVLGNLFRSTEFIRGQTELVVVVTPEIMLQGGEEDHALDRILAQEQALAVADEAAVVEDPILRYAFHVQERIAKSLRYPEHEKARGQPAQVKLRVHLLRDGTLQEALIAEPSGFDVFDQAAVRAAKSQSPFPMFPAELVQPDLWLELPVLFRP